MDIKEIGKRIRNYRVSRGLTQAELAERLKFTPLIMGNTEYPRMFCIKTDLK